MGRKEWSAGIELRRHPDGFLQIWPRPSADALAQYYNDKYFGANHGRTSYGHQYKAEELEHKRLSAEEALHVLRRNAAPRRMLDVGCGEGFMMDGFAQAGWDVRGLDFTSDGIDAQLPRLRPYLTTGDLFELLAREVEYAPGSYGFVNCTNVLEHVLEPERLARSLHGLLALEGMCRIQVPNDGSWLQALAASKSGMDEDFWVAYPDHLSYFTKPSLERFLTRCGWRVVALLADFPVDLYLLHPRSCYTPGSPEGRPAHFARVAFELGLRRQGLDELVAFRSGCAAAGVGRNLIAYVTSEVC